jgi:hypothetical protein
MYSVVGSCAAKVSVTSSAGPQRRFVDARFTATEAGATRGVVN